MMFGFGRKKVDPPAPAIERRSVERRAPAGPVKNAGVNAAPAAAKAKPRLVAVEGSKNPVADVEVRLPSVKKVIERLDEAPASQGLLTMGARAVMRIPKEYEHHVIAIELGLKRACILFNPECVSQTGMKSVMSTLRSKLYSEGYQFQSEGDLPCKPEVIKLMLDDFLSKNGVTDGQDVNRVRSMAKERFLSWLEIAVQEGATDIHVQVIGQSRALVQLRVDGELEDLKDQRRGIYTELEAMESIAWPFNSGSAKGSNSSAQWEAAQNLYCMVDARVVKNKQIALRYQSLRGHAGPKMVARLLHVDTNLPTLTYAQLGYADSQRMMMLDVAKMPSGFTLFSGVTGSGKTTSLKTFVETHPGNGTMAIYSMEDPVEYPLRGVHQIVLQRDVSNKEASMRVYNESVASLMRADPDIVIVGEIRDVATASASQQIVETGHMALGTVHAHLIPNIIPRLINTEIGMSRDVLTNPNMLSLLAYQALVPKLCSKCSLTGAEAIERATEQDAKLPGVSNEAQDLVELLHCVDTRFHLDPMQLRFKNSIGCPVCHHRGTKGVTVVAEMLIPDRPWLEFTRDGKDYEAMVHYRQGSDRKLDSPDMTGKTVFEHTMYKALLGGVDPRQCKRFDSFKRYEVTPSLKTSDRR